MELATEVALVREAGGQRDIDQGLAGKDSPLGVVQPPHRQIAMRTDPKRPPELTRQGEAIESCDRLKLVRSHGSGRLCVQIGLRAPHALTRHRKAIGLRPAEQVGEIGEPLIDPQALDLRTKVGQADGQRPAQ